MNYLLRSVVTALLFCGASFAYGQPKGPSAADTQLTDPVEIQKRVEEGAKMYRAKNYAGARTHFEQLLRKVETNADAYYYLGMIHLDQRKADKATELIGKAIEVNPNNFQYHLSIAAAYRQKAKKAKFLKKASLEKSNRRALEHALTLNPQSVEARMALFFSRLTSGSAKDAREQADELAKLDAYRGEIAYELIALSQKDSATAFGHYQKGLEIGKEGRKINKFDLENKTAKSIGILGTFTDWYALPLYYRDGKWMREVALTAGNYMYRFETDGRQITDPKNRNTVQDKDNKNSSYIVIK